MNKNTLSLILIIVFSFYLFLFGLGKMALLDPDEPFYAQTAREMLKDGEWLTPRIFGEAQFEKPPLYYWLIILSYKVFGVNEFAARFPSAVFGILGIIGIYLLGKRLFSKNTAIYSSIAMATAIEYIILARACVTDMVLSVFILYAFLFFFYELEKKNNIFCILSAVSLAFAVLTKGPIGFLLPVFVIVVFFLAKKDFMGLFKLPILWPIVVFIIVAFPWYYLMHRVHGKPFIDHFFGFQNVTRFLVPEHRIGDVFYYYIPIIFGGFFPWSIFLPCGIYQIIKKDKEKFKDHLFLLIWVSVFFIFFSLSRTKLPTYIFPLFPALAIVVGRFWDLISGDKEFSFGMRLSSIIYLISLPVGAVIFYIFSQTKYPIMGQAVIKSSFILVFVIISLVFFIRKKSRFFFGSIALTFAISLIPLTLIFSPIIDSYESSKDFAEYIENVAGPDEKIGAETDYRRGIAFYLDREDILDVHKHHIITKFLDSKKRVWAVIKDKNHWQLYTDERMPFWLPTYMVYKFGKKVIITNKIPKDSKFIKKRSINDPI